MNSQRFWAALARDLGSKPETGNLFYPVGDYLATELMYWALRRLRARDAWASNDPSQPLKFRSRVIGAGFDIYRAGLLRGGQWLFVIELKGTGYMLDLERELAQPQLLFESYRSSERPLNNF